MKKIVLHFFTLVFVFFATWFGLSRINYTGEGGVVGLTEKNEEKLGEVFMDVIIKTEKEIKGDSINIIVESITEKICKENKIVFDKKKIHVVDNGDVNAFTLPGRHMVVFTGLIQYCKTPEELAGVISHELSHMEKGHILKKLSKEVGLSILFAITGGTGSFEIIREVLKTISSTAFDREQETEADMHAVQLMSKSGFDPEHLANFLFRLSREGSDMPDEMILLSTHPGSAERAASILTERKKHNIQKNKGLKFTNWDEIRDGEWSGYRH